MFVSIAAPNLDTSFTFEGEPIRARTGEILAAALLRANVGSLRTTPRSGAPRAPYCMMGLCFECLVTVDGAPNRQACLEPVRPGMCVERQAGAAVAWQEGRT